MSRKKRIMLRFKSIQTSILCTFFTLIMSSMLVFLIISLEYTKTSILENATDYTGQLIGQVNSDMDSYITYMENISQMVTYSRDVNSYLFQTDSTAAADAAEQEVGKSQYERIISQFQTIMSTRKDICNIAVLGENGKNVINRGDSMLNQHTNIREKKWYQEAKEQTQGFALSTSHVQNVVAGDYDWVITLSRGLENRATNLTEGVFFIDLNYNTINDLCEKVSLGEKGYIYVLDEDGNIIYHPQQQLIYSGLKTEVIQKALESKNSFVDGEGKQSKVYTMSKSTKTGWTVVGVSYMSELMRDRKETQSLYIVMAVILMAVAIVMANLLAGNITRPIKKLDHSMKEVEKGHFENAEIEECQENEIGRLNHSFNIMTREIQNLMAENSKEQSQKRQAEMRALQAQIQPHFLYNTLDSIIWMAESGKNNQEVVIMTSSLAKLLRKSIGNDHELVTVAQELDYTKTYLTIQRIRYKDKLEFDISAEPEVLNEKIVRITLQPLVENAIYHGIKYAPQKGMLKIRGWMENDQIVLKVMDNGTGMNRETMANIFEKKTPNEKENGVGVYNVQNRLQLYYGKEYGLFYESKQGEGTVVTIKIPKAQKEKGHENE